MVFSLQAPFDKGVRQLRVNDGISDGQVGLVVKDERRQFSPVEFGCIVDIFPEMTD